MSTRFSVQFPRTLKEGLAGKTKIEKPMLFVFPETKVHVMWMKGMLVPIDIVFFDENGMVTVVYSNVPPIVGPKYSSKTPAKYAIECAAGHAGKLGLVPGARIRIFEDSTSVN